MKILIGADFVPTEKNAEYFSDGKMEYLVDNDLQRIIQSADYRIFNLEVPLADQVSPIDKCGPNLIAPTNTINGYKKLGVNLVTLANNHILDQGVQGLSSTMEILKKSRIDYVGAGANLQEASRPKILCVEGKKIGIYACAENEFSIATETSPGANPFDPYESLDHILDLRDKCDYLIVLYHGGKELYRYPSPYLQKVCRKIVDKGADLVICQHSHCIGCKELWNSGMIVYGQGNFLFDYSESIYWQTGLLVEVEFDRVDGSRPSVSFIPLKKVGYSVKYAKEDKKNILLDFEKRSEMIKNYKFVEEEYRKFANQSIDNYLSVFRGEGYRSIFYKILNKVSGHRLNRYIINKKYSKKILLALENFIECEAHRELLIHGLEAKRSYQYNRKGKN